MNKCKQCNQETSNPKFCSKSCSSRYNAFRRKRTKRKYHCGVCGIEVPSRRTRCDEHNPSYVDWNNTTLGDVKALRKYQPHSRIRELARRDYLRSDRPQACMRCSYSSYFEVCHIHAISDFSDDTPVSVINSLDNLIALCPNCHWELDNGLLSLDSILP